MALNKILLSDNVTELANVKSVVFKEAVNADVNIRPGCVGSASIEVEAYGTQASAVSAGDTVYYYQYDKNDNATLIGVFTCEPTIKTKTSYKFVAYDNAQKLTADFSQWLMNNQSSFPMTVKTLVQNACSVAGVTLGSFSWGLSTQNVQAFYADGLTCRDILSYAAEIGCCFVRCHTDGKVYFDWYASNANTIAPSVGVNQYAYKQDGLNYANFTTTALARVAVHPSGEDDVAYIYPTAVTSGNTLHIQNNLLLTGASASFYNAVAQQVYTQISALGTYRPMTANLFAKENPFRAGDIVSVTDIQGVTFTSVLTGMTVSNSGAVLESTGYETYSDITETAKKLVQLASDIVRINKLKVDWADIGTAIINELQANGINADWINTGALVVYDNNNRILFKADKTNNNVEIADWTVSYDKLSSTDSGYSKLDLGSAEIKFTYTEPGADGSSAKYNIIGSTLDGVKTTGLSLSLYDSGNTYRGTYEIGGVHNGTPETYYQLIASSGSLGVSHAFWGDVHLNTPLAIASGGTGLTASPSILTNLGSTSAANVLQASPRPGVTGILPVDNGGTGSNSKNFVDLSTAQTVGGTKTFTSYVVIDRSASAVALGNMLAILQFKYKNPDNQVKTVQVIRTYGDTETGTANNGFVIVGSNSGATVLCAGESAEPVIDANQSISNTENIYLIADGSINLWTGGNQSTGAVSKAVTVASNGNVTLANPLAIGSGGTGQNGLASLAGFATAGSNFTVTSATGYQWGKMVQVDVAVKCTTAVTVTTGTTMFTINNAALRPVLDINCPDSVNNRTLWRTNGNVQTFKTIAVNTTLSFRACYLVP